MSDGFTLTNSDIERLCVAGSKAPSGGNSQPWLVKVDKNFLSVFLDPIRSESFLDVGHYASYFGIGCFIENVAIEAESMGLKYVTELYESKEPLATLTFHKKTDGTSNSSLQQYIEKRVTNRQIYNGMTIEEDKIKELREEIQKEQAFGLYTEFSREGKERLADLFGQADAIRMMNYNTYEEMMHEFRWDEKEVASNDGLDIKTLEMPKNVEKLYRLLRDYPSARELMPQDAFAGMAKPLLTGSSHLCCLYTKEPLTPKNMLIAGRTFERLWLRATRLGIALQPWSILPFFLIRVNNFEGKGFSEKERERLKKIEKDLYQLMELANDDTPLFIFRLSYTDKEPSAHSLRISWKAFTHISQNNQ